MDMGKAIILKKKDGGKVYPISASDLIFNPETKRTVKDDLEGKIGDAPSDGKQYARINGGWSEVKSNDGEEILSISLKSNQESHEDLLGAIVTISFGGDTANYTWEGENIIVGIPKGTNFNVLVSDVNGYKTPKEKEYIAISGYSRYIEFVYQTELVVVELSADDDSSVSGQIVTINGEAITYSGTAVTKKVPFGTEYTVSVNKKSSYITPATQTFTASKPMRNLEMEYLHIPIGVSIQGVNGKFYSIESYDPEIEANGVAVVTSNHMFVISPKTINTSRWANKVDIPGLNNYGSISTAENDFDGKGNTEKIILNAENPSAAELAKSYIFPNGKTGYLGSVGEWNIVKNNISRIKQALNRISGDTIIETTTYWTSTEANSNNAWSSNINSGFSSDEKSWVGIYVRAFQSI